VTLSDSDLAFLQDNHSAAMITRGADGMPKVARCGVLLVDGKLWSSGTEDRVRTRRLRRDPRCTIYVHAEGFAWLALECTATILDGPDAPQLSLQLFRQMQGRPTGPLSWFGGTLDEEEFLQTMRDEQRIIYELEVTRSYGMH
jgi:PPOX class probable F420-dependent enzyme